jgi:hypothetical protein
MKQLIKNYTFDKTAKTITFADFVGPIRKERILLVTNTATGTIIYNFADATKLGTVSGNVLTLAYDTTAMSNTDPLQIFYDPLPSDNIHESVQAIGTEQVTWRRNFNTVGPPNTSYWTTVIGAGQTAAQTAGNLVITTGTTANATTSVTSKQTFTLPFRVQFTTMLSQRIANQSFYLEMVNSTGDTYAGYLLDGVTATSQKATSANGGFGVTASSVATNTTASNVVFELDARAEALDWNDVAANSAGTKTNRVRRTDNILDPQEEYFLRIRVVNGSTAPASNTTLTIGGVLVQDSTKFVAEIAGGRQTSSVAESIPAYITGSVGIGVSQGSGQNATAWSAAGFGGFLVTDVASGVITSTGTSATITPGAVANIGTYGMSFSYVVTAASGTNPTLDVVIQESSDNGTAWTDLYHFPRITAVGTYTTPIIKPSFGTRYRYVQTVTGTSPSFTRAINRIQHSQTGIILRNFWNRTIVPNTLNSVTPTYDVEGTKVMQLLVTMGAITTTAPTFIVEGSEDGTTFYPLPGSSYTPVANSTDGIYIMNVIPKFARVRVSSAGVAATLVALNLKAMED